MLEKTRLCRVEIATARGEFAAIWFNHLPSSLEVIAEALRQENSQGYYDNLIKVITVAQVYRPNELTYNKAPWVRPIYVDIAGVNVGTIKFQIYKGWSENEIINI